LYDIFIQGGKMTEITLDDLLDLELIVVDDELSCDDKCPARMRPEEE
jgi:hypothetical protein